MNIWCVSTGIPAGLYTHVCLWRPKTDVRYLLSLLLHNTADTQRNGLALTQCSPFPSSLASQVHQWGLLYLPSKNQYYNACFDLMWILGIWCLPSKHFIHWANPPGLPCILMQVVSYSCRSKLDTNNTSIATLPPSSHQTNHWTPSQEF